MKSVVYNESSHNLKFAPENIEEARNMFEAFVRLLVNIQRSKIVDTVQYFDNFHIQNICLFEGYTVNDWLIDKKVKREVQIIFRRLLDKYFSPVTSDEGLNEAYVKYQDDKIESRGCSWAIYSMEYPCVISAATSPLWKMKELDVDYLRLNEECSIVTEEHSVCNISELSDIDRIKKDEIDELFKYITSANDFWENKERLFPNLTFCDSVYNQINHTTKNHIDSIMKRLKNINEYFSEERSVYNPKELGMDARNESETVKNDKEMKKQRLFVMPSGESEYFFDHISFTGDFSGRIYFFPDVQNNTCCIGYIGKHLKTKKYAQA